jgi:prolyl-tRNA editing enzyme YbaK/EbsC (Cys-tRNA(Pro) deacylase)/SAM-dependent methyltransferase
MSNEFLMPADAKRLDIIIAIGKYRDPLIPDIECCENDGILLRDELQRLTYINGSRAQQTLLSTADGLKACSKTKILRTIEASTRELGQDDMLVLILTCHGCTINDETFIVPSDARANDINSLISAEWIKTILDDCKAKFKLILVDACHSGDSSVTFKAGATTFQFDEKNQVLGQLVLNSKGVAYATSCTHNQVALIFPDKKYSIWVSALAQSIRNHAALSNGGIVQAEPVIAQAMYQTVQDARRFWNLEQTPFCFSKVEGLLPLGIAPKSDMQTDLPNTDDIERATLIAFQKRFERTFISDMPVTNEENLCHVMGEKGFPLSYVVNVGPKGSRVRLAATFDLMCSSKPNRDNLVILEELATQLTLDRIIIPYLPPLATETLNLARLLKHIYLVELIENKRERGMFSDFWVMQEFQHRTLVLANEYSDILLRRMGKLFHIVLADIAAPAYDQQYGHTSFGTSEAMAYEDQMVNSAIARLDKRDFAVDLGCGTGRHTFEMSKFFKRIEGLDFSPGMIQVADTKKREHDLNRNQYRNVSFKMRDVETSPIEYGSNSVDLITACFGMGSFIENLDPFLTNIKDQLRPGGKAIFSFYNKEALVYSVPPPWRDSSLSAVLCTDRDELQVTLPSGEKFRIFCCAYTYGEIKGKLMGIFEAVQIHSCPTFASFLPSQYFTDSSQGSRARDLISHIDRQLAHHIAFPFGAYFTAICSKSGGTDNSNVSEGEIVDVKGEAQLLNFLEQKGVLYETLEHGKVRNIRDLQNELDVDPDCMCKAILAIIKADKLLAQNHVVFVIPGSRQLDLNKVSKLIGLNRREWRFALQKEVKKIYGLEIGGVPPFGYNEEVHIFIDHKLAATDAIYCGIGNPRRSIKIKSVDLLRISNAEVVDISGGDIAI